MRASSRLVRSTARIGRQPSWSIIRPQNAQTNPSGRGHQIMPAMTFANGRLTLLYYDLRLDHYADFYTPDPAGLGELHWRCSSPEGELAPPSASTESGVHSLYR